MSEQPSIHEVNVRSPRYFVAWTIAACPYCRAATALAGIALPPGHQVLDADDDPADEGPHPRATRAATWSLMGHHALLFQVAFLPAAVLDRIRPYAPAYRLDDDPAGGRSWTNHCESCGSRLDDDEVFCEPEGAFVPMNASSAAAIRIAPVHEPFEACAAGYSYEPPHFGALLRG